MTLCAYSPCNGGTEGHLALVVQVDSEAESAIQLDLKPRQMESSRKGIQQGPQAGQKRTDLLAVAQRWACYKRLPWVQSGARLQDSGSRQQDMAGLVGLSCSVTQIQSLFLRVK
jgi:hypothetical protein